MRTLILLAGTALFCGCGGRTVQRSASAQAWPADPMTGAGYRPACNQEAFRGCMMEQAVYGEDDEAACRRESGC